MYVHTLLSPYTYLSFSFYLEISSLESKGCDVSHWYVNHQLRHYDHPCCHSVVFHSDPALRQIWSHRHHQHGISLLYTMSVTMALLSIMGPAKFRASICACLVGVAVVAVFGGLAFLIMYLVSSAGGYCIPSPEGTPLFGC